jgi:hypothetical protein
MRRFIAFGLAAAAVVGFAGPAHAAPAANPAGYFVVGDLSASVGAHVEFWGAQWSSHNALSAGPASPAFKGFAANVDLKSCPALWASAPGNSAPPPAAIGSDITVIVASQVDKSGPVISGNAVRLATVHVDSDYANNPGHEGEGTVTSITSLDCGGSTTVET